jgi:arabinofuranosyltransferase
MPAAPRTTPPAALALLAFAASLVAFGLFWWDYRTFWIDDAFITFRYALHLAEGFGPVYNPGEFVEGYTSFLWMLITALPLKVLSQGYALGAIKYSGLVLGVWILYRVWTFPGPNGPTRRLLVILLATQPTFVINCGDGMETPLFMALMLECARAMVQRPSAASGAISGLMTTGLIWTRPESLPLIVALPVVMLFAWRGRDEARDDTKAWLRAFLLTSLIPVVLHQAWRWSYYGYPFPNTYYAKATGSQLDRLTRGYRDLYLFFVWSPWMRPLTIWLAIALALVGLVSRVRDAAPQTRAWLATLWLFVLFRFSFDLWSGSEAMGHHRFLIPLLIPLVILADDGLGLLIARLRDFAAAVSPQLQPNARRMTAIGLALLLFAPALVFNYTSHHDHLRMLQPYRSGLARGHIPLGLWLRKNYPRETWAAMGDAGTAPFFSRMHVIDLWGLNDETIAHLPGEYGAKKQTAEYVMKRQPELVILWNKVAFRPGASQPVHGGKSFDRRIAKHPRFAQDYRFVKEFVFRESGEGVAGYYLDVFEHRESLARRGRKGV